MQIKDLRQSSISGNQHKATDGQILSKTGKVAKEKARKKEKRTYTHTHTHKKQTILR